MNPVIVLYACVSLNIMCWLPSSSVLKEHAVQCCSMRNKMETGVEAHCCVESTGRKKLLGVITATEFHNRLISKMFRSEDLSQLVQN